MITYRGQIVPVFTIPPNWKKPVAVTEDWGDIIAETLDTGEERIGIRQRALYRLRYQTITLIPQETGYIRKVLEQDDAMPIAAALWEDAVRITAPSIAGNVFVNTEPTTDTLFDVVSYTLLWKSFREFSTVRTLDVFTLGLNFADGIDIDVAAGDYAIPMIIGKMSRENMVSLTDENATFEVKFTEYQFVDAPILCAPIDGVDLDVTLSFATECDGGVML